MTLARVVAVLVLIVASQQRAFALPTMIRLGYSECTACHISPQGGGLLNPYGRGIDREKVRKKAVSRGLIGEEESHRLSDRQVVQYIFHPGLSTAETVDRFQVILYRRRDGIVHE